MIDKLGDPRHLQPLPDRLGGGLLDAVPDVQALHLPGRRLRPAGDPLAGRHQGPRRGPPPVPPLHRHRPDHPRRAAASRCRRSSTATEQTPLPGVSMRYSFDAAPTRRPEGDPVLRDARHPRHLAPGLEGGHRARPDRSAWASSTRTAGSCSTPTRTAPRPTTWPTSTPRRWRSSRRCGCEEAGKYNVLPLNDLDASYRVPRRSSITVAVPAERPVHLLPGHLRGPGALGRQHPRRLVQDPGRGRVHRRRRGRDLRPGLALRRPLAVRQGRQAHLRLQLPRHPARAAARSPTRRRSGPHVVGIEFTKERMGEHHEAYGPLKLYVDDQVVAEGRDPDACASRFSLCGEGLCIGYDGGDAVSQRVHAQVRVHRWPDRQGRLRRRRRRATSTSSATSPRPWPATSGRPGAGGRLAAHYRRAWLRGDVVAALTTWALVVPQAIAYAQIAGLPPQAGLFAAFAGLLGYGLFGTSRQLIVSPTSSTAAISAAIVAPVALGDPERFAVASAALAILVGVVLIGLGLLRMGFVSRFIAAGVQVGFMFGLGLTIIVGQLPKLLGVPRRRGRLLQPGRRPAGQPGRHQPLDGGHRAGRPGRPARPEAGRAGRARRPDRGRGRDRRWSRWAT